MVEIVLRGCPESMDNCDRQLTGNVESYVKAKISSLTLLKVTDVISLKKAIAFSLTSATTSLLQV